MLTVAIVEGVVRTANARTIGRAVAHGAPWDTGDSCASPKGFCSVSGLEIQAFRVYSARYRVLGLIN